MLLGGKISHDVVTRFLVGEGEPPTAKEWWFLVKTVIRQIASEEGILNVDDTLAEKPNSKESPIICWRFDHTKGRNIKGINLLTLLYSSQGAPQEEELLNVPLSFRLIEKTEWESRRDEQRREQHRRVSAKKP